MNLAEQVILFCTGNSGDLCVTVGWQECMADNVCSEKADHVQS